MNYAEYCGEVGREEGVDLLIRGLLLSLKRTFLVIGGGGGRYKCVK